MVWAAFTTGWVLGCVSLYSYMLLTAQEPDKQECVDCRLTDCSECPYESRSEETEIKRAA